jgi:Kelch motif protein
MLGTVLGSLWRRAAGLGSSLRRLSVPLCGLLMLCGTSFAGGTWTLLTNQNPEFESGTMILLSDGNVIVQSLFNNQTWSKLSPTSDGSYVNGTWSTIATMSPRLNFGSTTLEDGRLLVLGGETSNSGFGGSTNQGQIYNPRTNKWTTMSPFPESTLGAGPLVMIPNGYVVVGSTTTDQVYVYYPPFDEWFFFFNIDPLSNGGISKLRKDISGEETWLLQPDGSILSYDISASITNSAATAQRFSGFSWVDAGTLPSLLTIVPPPPPPPPPIIVNPPPPLGPGAVLPNGKTIQIGGNENTAIYTPGGATGTWVAGPTLPVGMGADDAPGAMLPDGHFLFVADFTGSFFGGTLFDYDYNTNTITDLTSTLPLQLQDDLFFSAASNCRMLVLPDGGLLLNTGFDIWEYKSAGVPQAAWRPNITSVSKLSPSQYEVFGSRLTGISEGAIYGNEARMSTNFPIVVLQGNGKTRYARTIGFNAGMSRPGSTNFDSMEFEIPPGTPAGTYNVSIVANGIKSNARTIQFSPSGVTAAFSNGVLTITGDGSDNLITVTYKQVKVSGILKSASVTVTANDTFTLVNGGPSATFDVGIQRFKVSAAMNGGNDSVTFNSLFLTDMNCSLGAGDDTLTLMYNSISNQLTVDGGTNDFDTVTLTGNSIGKKAITNVP